MEDKLKAGENPDETVSGNDIISGNDIDTGTPPDTGKEDTPPNGDTGTGQSPPEQNDAPEEEDHDSSADQPLIEVEVQHPFDSEQLSQVVKDITTGIGEHIAARTDELAHRLDEMILLLTPEESDIPESPTVRPHLSIPFADYTGFNYPVNVTYGITTVSGYSTYESKELESSGAFEEDFEKMQDDVDSGYLQSFYIRYVYGAGDDGFYNVLLYDSDNPATAPEADPAVNLLLSHLEGVNAYLADISASDAVYHQSTLEYREEMLDLQRADTASTIILCVAVFIVAAEVAVISFFRRFR